MKPDELRLLLEMPRAYPKPPDTESFRQIAERLGIHNKRACYIAVKWSRKGWYEYGVCCDLGWLRPEGIKVAQEIKA